MHFSFRRTNLALTRDGATATSVLLVSALILAGAWIAWAFYAQVTRYEISDSARLEVTAASYPVQASITGRVVANYLTLGREVQAGDVLAELDSASEELTLAEERTRAAAFEPQVAALRAEMQVEASGHEHDTRALNYSLEAANAELRQAEAQAALAAQDAVRGEKLQKEGIIASAELERLEAEATQKRAAEQNLRAALERLRPEQQVRDTDREVKLRELDGQIAKVEADAAASRATIRRLAYEVERRKIRAPVAGRLSECAVLPPGSHISEGQQLGVIVPAGALRITAEFQPSAALGKVRPGEPATMRLEGFPWAQYGTISARVLRVAGEIRDGKVRVELAVNGAPRTKIPLQHGLPGSVEVEIERISPAALILRSAGDMVGAH